MGKPRRGRILHDTGFIVGRQSPHYGLSKLRMDAQRKVIKLKLDIGKEISDMVEYFEIFTARMVACRRVDVSDSP